MDGKQAVIIEGSTSKYLLRRVIDSGGMSTVYLGEDAYTGEKVAIKIPLGPPVSVDKLRFEAKILRSLSHPVIVKWRDYAEHNGQPVLVEEYVDGATLDKAVRKERPGSGRVKAILLTLLLALDYLHSLNIVHRDVKPKNLMIDDNLEPRSLKMIDLGTSIYYNAAGVKEIVYSPGGYTAPEQYMGISLPQSDIWGAMATAFFLATGRDPATLMPGYPARPPHRPIDPRIVARDIDPILAGAISKGMSWNALDRFLSAREAIDYLEEKSIARFRTPVIEVFGLVVPIQTTSLVLGRMAVATRESSGTRVTRDGTLSIGGERLKWWVEKDVTFVLIADPFRWISRSHFEIRKLKGKWCIRDLGSTNRTAVLTRKGLFEVWRGKGVVSPCHYLGDRALILTAYGSSLRNPPYVTVVFRAS